jgi:GMP synthase (glutamine-hydrolysing)
MPAPVACLHHLAQPFLGHAATALHAAGVPYTEHDLRHQPLPDVDDVSALISFGGDQSVTEIERHPVLREEAALLAEAVEREIPVLGVCLGGQLLAHALGGSVRRMPRRMLGWFEVGVLPAAADDPVFGVLRPRVTALHWNEDAFEVADGAVELLSRAGPGVEAFRAGPAAWGIQFHPEVDAAALDSWYEESPEMVAEAGTTIAAARAADIRHLAAQEELAQRLFGAFARVASRRITAR